MATKTLDFTGEVVMTYDENSPEFQAALASYREDDAEATVDQVLKWVAQNLTQWGDHERMIEGVGYVALKGQKPEGEPYSGIEVEANYDDHHFD